MTGRELRVVYTPDGESLGERGFDFCPGCGYGSIVLSLVEAVRGLEDDRRPLFLLDIGCVDFMVGHLPGDTMVGPHGRTPAIATGVKRVDPGRVVVAIQGDGGFVSVGAAEALHAAMRGEPFTIVVLNNGVLADTGGQFSSATPVGLPTSTAPADREGLGAPVPFLEMLAGLPGVAYAERVSLDGAPAIRRVTRALSRALEVQREGAGLGIVEILSPCPTHWRMEPEDAWTYIRDRLVQTYPTGVLAGSARAEG